MSFWIKINFLIKRIFPNYVWDIPNNDNKVFLTFDDGPTPGITDWVLEQLKNNDAKATFFCIGKNIEHYPDIFQKIIREDHAIGNHTFNHLQGWTTKNESYIDNVRKCNNIISEFNVEFPKLFRPPYGKIKPSQSKLLRKMGYKIIMWDVLSMDYNTSTTPEKCLKNVINNIEAGSIIVFHDSKKAEQNLRYILPKTLQFLKEKGFVCEKIY